jgi:hypothetical protein
LATSTDVAERHLSAATPRRHPGESLEVGDAMRVIVIAPLDAQRRSDVAARSTAVDGTHAEIADPSQARWLAPLVRASGEGISD